MNQTEQFFYDNAGYSYDPKTETKEKGRRRTAAFLAQAESKATEQGFSFQWRVDPYMDSSEFSDDPEPWALWECLIHAPDGSILTGIGGIDFGRDGEPWGDNYRRVVEAELALESLNVCTYQTAAN